jgi:alkylation response protein AidB-like acyl-CoA dehydrogenase
MTPEIMRSSKAASLLCPYFQPNRGELARTAADKALAKRASVNLREHRFQTYTIFEGTSEIQRLIIARAISGVHIQ